MAEPFISFDSRPAATARVFCLPHAGGFASAYRDWARNVRPSIEMRSAVLPGRGSRAAEGPITRMHALVDELAKAVSGRTEKPYALFGHSMGSLIAFELVHRLDALGLRGPSRLFVSASPPPGSAAGAGTRLGDRGDAEMMQHFCALGGIPKAVADNPEAMATVLPALKADLELVRNYRTTERRPIRFPIMAVGGLADPLVARSALAAWADWTTAGFSLRMFAGGHFYLQEHRSSLLAMIEREFEQVTHPAMG